MGHLWVLSIPVSLAGLAINYYMKNKRGPRRHNGEVDCMCTECDICGELIRSKKITASALFPSLFVNVDPSAAQNRAAQLLWDHLSEDQKREAIIKHTITIHSQGRSMVLSMIDPHKTWVKPRAKAYYPACINSVDSSSGMPVGDRLLQKKLAFEADPVEFLKIANY